MFLVRFQVAFFLGYVVKQIFELSKGVERWFLGNSMLRAKALGKTEAPQSVVEVSDDVIDIVLRYTLPESAKIILVCLPYISLQRNKTSKHGEKKEKESSNVAVMSILMFGDLFFVNHAFTFVL